MKKKSSGSSYVVDSDSPVTKSAGYTRYSGPLGVGEDGYNASDAASWAGSQSLGSSSSVGSAGLKSGGAPVSAGSMTPQTGYDVNGNPFTYTQPLSGKPASNTPAGRASLATAAANEATARGVTPGTTPAPGAPGYTSTISPNAAALGSDYLSSISQNVDPAGDTLARLGVTPESLAYDKYKSQDKFAQRYGAEAETAFRNTMGVAQNSYNLGQQYLDITEQNSLAQAERMLGESLATNDIAEMKADKEYEAAVAANKANREKESQYLKQKLASAGAINSTAGLEILVESSSNYESALSSLQGDRQIALAEFALADTQVRNTYATNVENLYAQTAGLRLELTNAFQTAALNAVNALTSAKTEAAQNQEGAYYDYLTTLSQIDAAEKAAQAEAEAQARADQQQAFDNAISLAGLTGTFVDPMTGETIRTLNGMKFDMDLAGGSGSGSTYAELLQKGLQYGILTAGQNGNYESVANDEDYQALLEQQIGLYESNIANQPLAPGGFQTPLAAQYYGKQYDYLMDYGSRLSTAFPMAGVTSSTKDEATGVTTNSKNVYPTYTPPVTSTKPKSWNLMDALGL